MKVELFSLFLQHLVPVQIKIPPVSALRSLTPLSSSLLCIMSPILQTFVTLTIRVLLRLLLLRDVILVVF